MPSLQEYTKKLSSLKNTLKLTKTMKMVSASKLRRAQDTQRNAEEYARQISNMIGRLAVSIGAEGHALMTPRPNAKKAHVLMFTSDKGLCGGFNNNLIKFVNRWVQENKGTYDSIDMSFCGRRGYGFFQKRETVVEHYENVTPAPNFSDASRIGEDLCEGFISERWDDIYLAFNIFNSPLSQTPHIMKLLPIAEDWLDAEKREATEISPDYIFEPTQTTLLNELIPRIINFRIFYALLENSAGEHGARMTAMDSATGNASNMIETYTLLRNRARQAAITTELIEIISGAEAL